MYRWHKQLMDFKIGLEEKFDLSQIPEKYSQLKEILLQDKIKEEERRSVYFRKVLDVYIPLSGFEIPKKVNILNVGCDECFEAEALNIYFGQRSDLEQPNNVFLLGLDINDEGLQKAIKRYEGNPNYRFVQEDAKRLRRLTRRKFDVVISRAPESYSEPKTWTEIYQVAKKSMKDTGILLATNLCESDYEPLKQIIDVAGFKTIVDEENRILPVDGEMRKDLRIIIAKKK